jgi:LemA protein
MKNKMNRNILIFVGIIAMVVLFGGCGYNSMVKLDEKVNSQWAQVENVYQRRSDLIPNLVNTVKGYANFEKDVLTSVTEARSKATSVNIDPSKLTPESIQQFQAAQGQLTSALSKLLVVVEKYPDLKANQNFLELQAQLEGTENRIAVERNSFNKVTQEYNSKIRSFPNNITAGIFGFAKKGYFEAEKGAEKAPEVKF